MYDLKYIYILAFFLIIYLVISMYYKKANKVENFKDTMLDIKKIEKFEDTNKKIDLPLDSYMNESGQNIVEQKYGIKYNTMQHQFGGSECGVYSINFIVRLLRGDQFDEINKSRNTDKEMNVCRKKYFSGYDNIIKDNNKMTIC